MLRVVPKGWLSQDFAIVEDHQTVAVVRFARSSGKAEFTVGEDAYTIRDEHPGYESWVLETEGEAVARARSLRTIFWHLLVVEYAGKRYELEDRYVFRRKVMIREGVQTVGYIEAERALSRRLCASLPQYLRLAVRVFMIALVVNPWADRDEIMWGSL